MGYTSAIIYINREGKDNSVPEILLFTKPQPKIPAYWASSMS